VVGDFHDLVRHRKMVRSFSSDPVDPAAVHRILDVARRGPTAGFSQGVEFVVVTDEDMRAAIAAPSEQMLASALMENFVAQAPVHIVVCTSPEIYRRRYRESDKQRVVGSVDEDDLWSVPFWYTDAGAAKMLILLAAVDEGLGACFVGVLPGQHEVLRELLDVPDEYELVGIALLGHASERADQYSDVSAATRRRRPFDEVVHRERW
jgi:nitroreductase